METPTSESKEHIFDLASRYVCPHRVETWRASGIPLVMGRREGYEFWDLDGRRLIDVHLNGGTFNLGHRNPEIIAAMVEATGTLDIGNHHFPSIARSELAEVFSRLACGLSYSVFAASGSEAVDVAIKSARWATGRRKIVALSSGYHGRTGLSGAAGEDASSRYFLSDHPDEFLKVPFNDLDAMYEALHGRDVAAVLMETIPATSGFPIPVVGYLPGVKKLCEEYGTLYIADEVQTGLGRTGHLWGVDGFEVSPDILVAGKGLSGGVYPIAVALLSDRAGGWLQENGWGHVSTFGGSEIGCRVARKVLEVTTRQATTERIRLLIARFGDGLRQIRTRQPYLVDIRQSGLVIGLKFDHSAGGVYVQEELYRNEVWAIASGFDQSVLQFKPGLLLDDAVCDEVLDRLEGALSRAKDKDHPVRSRHRMRDADSEI